MHNYLAANGGQVSHNTLPVLSGFREQIEALFCKRSGLIVDWYQGNLMYGPCTKNDLIGFMQAFDTVRVLGGTKISIGII